MFLSIPILPLSPYTSDIAWYCCFTHPRGYIWDSQLVTNLILRGYPAKHRYVFGGHTVGRRVLLATNRLRSEMLLSVLEHTG